MMGAVVDKAFGKLVVKDGKYTVQFNVRSMSVMGATADLNGMKYYPGGYVRWLHLHVRDVHVHECAGGAWS